MSARRRSDGATHVLSAVARSWPVVVLCVAVAATATTLFLAMRTPTYSASTTVLVTPLAQSDDTFLGTGLIRDSGDPSTTAATVARLLATPAAADATAAVLADGHGGTGVNGAGVSAAVTITQVDQTTVLLVTARSTDPQAATTLARTYTEVALAGRWRDVAASLDRRMAALSGRARTDPTAVESLDRLAAVRDSGSDPTLTAEFTGAAVPDRTTPPALLVALAALAGLVVGVLAAVALARRRDDPGPGAPPPSPPSPSPQTAGSTSALPDVRTGRRGGRRPGLVRPGATGVP